MDPQSRITENRSVEINSDSVDTILELSGVSPDVIDSVCLGQVVPDLDPCGNVVEYPID